MGRPPKSGVGDGDKNEGRTSIDLPADVLKAADMRWKALEYKSRNQYILALVKIDLRDRPDHVEVRSENAPPAVTTDRVIDLQSGKPGRAKRKDANGGG